MNNGLQNSSNATLAIFADGNQIYTEAIPPLQIGESITFILKHIWVQSMNVKQLDYQIQANFSEINKNNNQIKLEIQ
jgi:hypothetical protein